MYLYLILGAAIVLRKQLFELFSHLIPFLFKGIKIVITEILKFLGKGVYHGVRHSHNYTYKKIGEFDTYMMQQSWRRL